MHFNTWYEKLSAVLKQAKTKANRNMYFLYVILFGEIYTNMSTQASCNRRYHLVNTTPKNILRVVEIKEGNIKLTKLINCLLIKSCLRVSIQKYVHCWISERKRLIDKRTICTIAQFI